MQEHPAIKEARQRKQDTEQKLEYIINLANAIEPDKVYEESDSSLVLAINPLVVTEYKKNLEKTMKISEMIDWVDNLSDQILFVFEKNTNKPIKKNGSLHLHLLELQEIVNTLKLTLKKINI